MKVNKKALVLLNMGGARSKDELKVFLKNMFNDKNILTLKSDFLRKIIAFFIVNTRINSAWENYEKIDGKSPIYDFTDKLVKKLEEEFEGYNIYTVMRYTPPFSDEVVKQMKKDGIEELILFPLYPQYSTTTTKSSLEDFYKYTNNEFKVYEIEPFYKNKLFNKCIIDEILSNIENPKEYNLIFSAHGLPQKIVDNGDPYEKQINEHVNILSKLLEEKEISFKSINLAYQSKVGPMKWLEPSLDDSLKNFKDEKVLIYPIAFIIDNSETTFELDIEYRHIAQDIGVKEFKVCKCVNDSDSFVQAMEDIIKNND
ncbi:MAG: ferrochelatase [Arcobacter sp.]|nr:ferrochelatase [Arcobacter sp.]